MLRKIINVTAATAAIALPFGASAQTSITLYGLLDVSVEYLHFNSTPTRPSSHLSALTSDTSRLGVRGSEDLGDGLRAYFKIENRFQADTGVQTNPTAFFSGESYVGIGDVKWGSVQLGSQFTPGLWASIKADPFTRFGLGGQYTLLQGLRGYQSRYDNAVQYVSPNLAGVSGRLIVAAGEGAANGPSYSGYLEYDRGPIYVGAVLDKVKTSAASVGLRGDPVRSQTLSLAATYDFKVVKFHGWYQTNRIESLSNVNGYMAAVSVPVGLAEFRASYSHRNATNADSSLAAVGGIYFLSKRTSIYATVGRLNNSGTAAIRVGPALSEQAALGLPFAGQDIGGAQVGIRHWF